jgi:hypothetical protein
VNETDHHQVALVSSTSIKQIVLGALIEAGLTDVSAEPVTLDYSDLNEAATVLPLQPGSPVRAALGKAFEDFFDALDRAAADGTLLISRN